MGALDPWIIDIDDYVEIMYYSIIGIVLVYILILCIYDKYFHKGLSAGGSGSDKAISILNTSAKVSTSNRSHTILENWCIDLPAILGRTQHQEGT